MNRPPFAQTNAIVIGAAVLAFASACGSGGKGSVTPGDAGPDSADAARMGVTCTAAAAGEKRGLGACCAAAAECAGGVCWNGFCTKTCAAPADCGPVVAPSPLPAGTTMSCATNQLGDPFSYCLPGSLAPCANGAACPKGEDCALSLSPTAVPPANASSTAYAGACMTTLVANHYPPAGSACEPEAGPYACENEGGYLGSGCLAHRCTRACATDADCPVATFCSAAPYSPSLGGVTAFLAHAGVGVCVGRLCGQVHGQAGLATNQVTQQGADAVCPTGEICAPTMAVGAAGDTEFLSCIPPRGGAVAVGMPCSTDPAAKMRCADDSLCVARGGAPFCSTLCRNDADCPTVAGDGYVCMDDFVTSPLPNGSVARLSLCTPRASVVGRVCLGEKDCAASEACLPASGRTTLMTCQPAVGTKSVGDACAAAAECRSGECVDRDLHNATGINRTFCGGYCAKNSNCGAGQICLTVVRNTNATTDLPTDDIALGYCAPLAAPPLAGSCKMDIDCAARTNPDETGGDTCDALGLTCYKKTAHIGDACVHRAQCPLGAYCRVNDPRFPGGACLAEGCDPAAITGVDACPAGSLCTQRPADRPLFACYEVCVTGQPCSRQAEQYYCDSSAPAGAPRICLASGGSP